MEIVGIIPAAGYATRLQPLQGSKEVYPVGGRPVMDYLVDRMRIGGSTQLRVVTRPDKQDVIAHAREVGAAVVVAEPASVSESFEAALEGLAPDDAVLIGFPDTLWEPEDGYKRLVEALSAGCDVALGLFRIDRSDLTRSDVVVFDAEGGVTGIEVKPAEPPSEWIWGCAAAPVRLLAGLSEAEWPGGHFDRLCRSGCDVRGIQLSDAWLDIGTRATLQRAEAWTRQMSHSAGA